MENTKINFDNEINAEVNKLQSKVNQDKWALRFHLMPKIGWLNDPNGLCYFNGEYHVFYQYSPLNANGGIKFWGHSSSKDLVSFKDEGIALYPDRDFDRGGVYSGSAFIEEDQMHIFYTGNVKVEKDNDVIIKEKQQNVVYTKSKDGINFEEKKLLLTNKEFPESFTAHVRDPKVWKENDEYFMVLGARGKDDKGYVAIYKSINMEKWELYSIPAGGVEELGYMWECPDFISIDNKDILLICPQGIEANGYLYNNVYQSGYMLGEFTDDKKKFNFEEFIELDRGFDFYAPQTFQDNKKRRILIGWMGLPDIVEYENPTLENHWQHCLTMARELFIKNHKLMQRPLEETKKLRKQHFNFYGDINGERIFEELKSEVFELKIDIEKLQGDFQLCLRGDCNLIYNSDIKTFELLLGESGFGRKSRKVRLDRLESIHVFSDTSSIEIFLNSGEEVFTTRFYQCSEGEVTKINCNGILSIDKWDI